MDRRARSASILFLCLLPTLLFTNCGGGSSSSSSSSPAISPALSITTTQNGIGGGEVGVAYAATVTVTGGVAPYTYSASNLPGGLSMNATTGVISGMPTKAGSYAVAVTVKGTSSAAGDSATATFTITIASAPDGTHSAMLQGRYACVSHGFVDATVAGSSNTRSATLFSFAANGAGTISSGLVDSNSVGSGYKSGTFNGSYNLGSDNRGIMQWGSNQFSIAAGSFSNSIATQFRFVEVDDAGATPSGQNSSGVCYLQTPTAFQNTALAAVWAFGFSGEDIDLQYGVMGGVFTLSATGGVTAGVLDDVRGPTVDTGMEFIGTVGSVDSGTGRFKSTITITYTGSPVTSNWVGYVVDGGRMLMLTTDPHGTSDLWAGELRMQIMATSTVCICNGSLLTAPVVAYGTGGVYPASTTATPGYMAELMQGAGDGATGFTVNSSLTSNGTTASANSMLGAVPILVQSNGRAVTNGSNPLIGLYFYGENQAFLLDMTLNSSGGTNEILGLLEAQNPSSSWSDSNLAGAYMSGSMASGNTSMDSNSSVISVASAGAVSGTEDSAGEGNVNLDQPLATGLAVGWVQPSMGYFNVVEGSQAQMGCYAINTTRSVCLNLGSGSGPLVDVLQQ